MAEDARKQAESQLGQGEGRPRQIAWVAFFVSAVFGNLYIGSQEPHVWRSMDCVQWLKENRNGLLQNAIVQLAVQVGPAVLGLVGSALVSLAHQPIWVSFLIGVVTFTLLSFAVSLWRRPSASEPARASALPLSAPEETGQSPPDPENALLVERTKRLLRKDIEVRNSETRGLLALEPSQAAYAYWKDDSIVMKLGLSARNTWMDPLTVENWGGKATVGQNEFPLPADVEAKTVQAFSAHMLSCTVTWTPSTNDKRNFGLDHEHTRVLGVTLQPILNCLVR